MAVAEQLWWGRHVQVTGPSRPLRPWDLDLSGGQVGPLALPGNYTARVAYKSDTATQVITVLRDPYSAAADAEMAAQFAETRAIHDDMNTDVDMINQLEWFRKQFEDITFMLNERKSEARERLKADTVSLFSFTDSTVRAVRTIIQKAIELESKLFDVDLAGAREDAFRAPNELYEKLAALASDVGANSADWGPTNQQREVHALLRKQLEDSRGKLGAFIRTDVADFNKRMAARGMPTVMSQLPAASIVP